MTKKYFAPESFEGLKALVPFIYIVHLDERGFTNLQVSEGGGCQLSDGHKGLVFFDEAPHRTLQTLVKPKEGWEIRHPLLFLGQGSGDSKKRSVSVDFPRRLPRGFARVTVDLFVSRGENGSAVTLRPKRIPSIILLGHSQLLAIKNAPLATPLSEVRRNDPNLEKSVLLSRRHGRWQQVSVIERVSLSEADEKLVVYEFPTVDFSRLTGEGE